MTDLKSLEGTTVEFTQLQWTQEVEDSARNLVELAFAEDLGGQRDWTSWSSIDQDAAGRTELVARAPGVVCGLPLVPLAIQAIKHHDPESHDVTWIPLLEDGTSVAPGDSLGTLSGATRTILQLERTVLNFIGRLSGIATLTSRFVNQISGSVAKVYDTRKTTPGWRLLEKYAVGQGGGQNHRLGLYAAVMLKDNHLAGITQGQTTPDYPTAIQNSQKRLAEAKTQGLLQHDLIFEVEVDTLEQLEQLLPLKIDIILLDNMTQDQLRKAVALRNRIHPSVQLEASGNVRLSTIAEIAATGVDRISSGALTHSATNWDVGLDWKPSSAHSTE